MHRVPGRRVSASLAAAAIAVIALAGCSSGGNAAKPSSTPTETGHQTVTIYGVPTGVNATQLAASWNGWAAEHDITIQYTGDQNFASNIATKIQGNALPDIAMFPQPGLLRAAVATGKVAAVNAATETSVKKNFSESWQQYVTVKGKMYGTPLDANVKGYVWYSPAQFAKWGVKVPTSYAELLTATETIAQKTGNPPWCVGFNAGTSSGWPGADQLAELVLGSAGEKTYDDWVAGKVKFTDPAIDKAFTLLGKLLQNPKYVNAGFGGVASINSTSFRDVAAKLAGGSCAMTNQATFLKSSFSATKTAAGTTPVIGPDGDVWAFLLPAVNEGKNAVTGGGDFGAAFNNRPAVQKVMEYLSSSAWANSLVNVAQGTYISANKGVAAESETDPLLRSAIETLQSPKSVFRFGADDAMPSVVETAFWAGMVAWINGTPQKQVEEQIQAAWASVE